MCSQQCPGVWGSRRSPRGAGGAPQREEKRGAGGLGAPTPGDAPITRRLAGGRSGPGRARNSNYFLRSCRTGLPLRARLLWGWVLGATALRRPWGCSPMLPEQPRSLQWGQRWPPWKCILIPGPEPRSGFAWGETGVKGQKAGLGQAARDIPKASPAAQPRGPDPSGQGPQQGVGDSGRPPNGRRGSRGGKGVIDESAIKLSRMKREAGSRRPCRGPAAARLCLGAPTRTSSFRHDSGGEARRDSRGAQTGINSP